ncbi:MAG: hypothetical protein ACF8Q5_12160 [Phycisphaerales bacterium JB040]
MRSMISVAVVAAVSGSALADGGDYGLWTQNGKVQTAIGDHTDQVLFGFGERVFAADMLGSVATGWEADEPGIFIPEASLPDNTAVGFNILGNLLYWDGTGPVSAVDASVAMTLRFGPESRVTPGDASTVAGFTINYDADAVGGFDEHYDYLLGAGAAEGIYFLQNSFTLSGFQESRSVWTVFNAGLTELEHDAAIEYAETVLVPAPGAAGVLAMAGLIGARRRRS